MPEQNDQEYFATRAAIERALSDTACDPSIALIHARLADRYEKLIERPEEARPALHLVTI